MLYLGYFTSIFLTGTEIYNELFRMKDTKIDKI